jgi:uncharacterized FAD-dependent dehydrogenase
MQKRVRLSVAPETAANEQLLKKEISSELKLQAESEIQLSIIKRSVDARSKKIKINLEIDVFVNEIPIKEKFKPSYKEVNSNLKVAIIGAGPAGLFAALKLIENGIQPIIFERGKNVRDRRRDLAALNKQHIVNPESNYCFGEGGAGTYSDGKLYTRSNKRGDINKILDTFIYHGASPEIKVDAHPHIGTNKLPEIITNIRNTILENGGEIHFDSKLINLRIVNDEVKTITIHHQKTDETKEYCFNHLILATGHSARDIFELLRKKNILIEAKPFALGVRIEHPQEVIDKIQYHCSNKEELDHTRNFLPAASYSLVQQVNERGVYSFCMCPGGIIAPCATAPGEIVTNGWSPSKRNNPFANSGLVVGLELKDFQKYQKEGALAGLRFQQEIEKKAWIAGGKTQTAPAQRLTDFLQNKSSSTLPDCSYHPGIKSSEINKILGPMISNSIREGLKAFGEKMKGYITEEAVLVATESRTSTPVRIPRNQETGEHVKTKGLYPCGEGAGYAGGIVSAAMDGERVALAAAMLVKK